MKPAQSDNQEPVVWMYKCGGDTQINTLPPECYGGNWTRTPLYTAPPKHEWQGLTDDEISAVDWKHNETLHDYARAIEAKLKEKNT